MQNKLNLNHSIKWKFNSFVAVSLN